MSDGANFHPHVVLRKNAEDFKTVFDEGIQTCLGTLDMKIGELSSPQVLSVPVNELGAMFSKAKSDIFQHMDKMIAELSELWMNRLCVIRDTFIEDVKLFLDATKLLTVTNLEVQASALVKKRNRSPTPENIPAENMFVEAISQENEFVKNIEISLSEAIVDSTSPEKVTMSTRTPEVVTLSLMKKLKRSPSTENIETLSEIVDDPSPKRFIEYIKTAEVMCGPKQVSTLEEFFDILREYEIQTCTKFVCISSSKSFTDADFTPTKNMKIHWNNCLPQYYIGRRNYACHLGKDTNVSNKKKYAEKRDSKANNELIFIDRRNLAQPTKKLGCPVVIKVARVLNLPRFKVNEEKKWKKVKMAELIKQKLVQGEDIGGENAYCFELPPEDSHQNHVVTVKESIDHKVRSKIKELVAQGNRKISVISSLVEQFVESDIDEKDKYKSRFHPSKRCVRSIVKSAIREIKRDSTGLSNLK